MKKDFSIIAVLPLPDWKKYLHYLAFCSQQTFEKENPRDGYCRFEDFCLSHTPTNGAFRVSQVSNCPESLATFATFVQANGGGVVDSQELTANFPADYSSQEERAFSLVSVAVDTYGVPCNFGYRTVDRINFQKLLRGPLGQDEEYGPRVRFTIGGATYLLVPPLLKAAIGSKKAHARTTGALYRLFVNKDDNVEEVPLLARVPTCTCGHVLSVVCGRGEWIFFNHQGDENLGKVVDRRKKKVIGNIVMP